MNFELRWGTLALQGISLGLILFFLDYVKVFASKFYMGNFLDNFVLGFILISLVYLVNYLIILFGRRLGVFT